MTITDKSQLERLNEKHIVIEEIYLDRNKKLIRRTDGKKLDQINFAPLITKKYYYNNKCIHKEKGFDKNSYYTFNTYNEDTKVKCPNCGSDGNIDEFYESCPYCSTEFNIDYKLKRYNFNTIKDKFSIKLFKFITALIAIIIPFIAVYIINKDIRLAFLSILLFPLSFVSTYYILIFISAPFIFLDAIINKYYESYKITNGKISRNTIINSLIYELKHHYFNDINPKDLIDFEIIKYYYISLKTINNELYVEIKYKIKKYYYKNKKIKKKIDTQKTLLKYNKEYLDRKNNIMKCDNCGASIDVTKKHCEYCKTKVKTINEWYLEKIF